jgi:hypothetical protein
MKSWPPAGTTHVDSQKGKVSQKTVRKAVFANLSWTNKREKKQETHE